jgi:Ca2+-binding EF-hand superfamily protein
MHTKIATAIVLSLAFAPQPRGWVSSVTAAADASVGTVQITVRGNNPCGAVNLDYGDGTSAVTHAISQLPVTIPHEFTRVGEYTVRARGQGNCDGDVFTRVNVSRVRGGFFDRRENPFAEMDQNGDGIITRAEWRGTAQAFDAADWNNDGRLSGDEVRMGAVSPNRFAEMDTNRDGVITRAEWRGSAQAFDVADWNNDGRLSGDEVRAGAATPNSKMRFAEMDRNRDGMITRAEWRGNAQSFNQHDWNGDGRLSGEEVREGAKPTYQWTEANFRRLDRNRDNYLSGNEWRYEPDDFLQVDRNRDDRVSLAEFIDGDRALGGFEMPGGRGRGRGNDPLSERNFSVIVNNGQTWIDTGLEARAGDTLDITATGRVQYSRQFNDVTGPNGNPGITRPRAPMPNMPVGALVARVGNSAPFFVGARGNALRVPQNGRLYLGINDDILNDNSGEFRVNIQVSRR